MTRTEHTAETKSAKIGPLATLAALLPTTGTTAPAGFRAPAPSRRAGRVPAVLCGVAAVLALAATLLLGAVSAAAAEPTVTVDPVSAHAITTARATGTITTDSEANGGAEAIYFFEYTEAGKEEWNFGPRAFERTVPAETTAQAVEEDLSGLNAQTAYEVRLVAFPVIGGKSLSAPSPSFTTDPAPNPPVVELQAPTPSYIHAHIQGSVDPEGGNLDAPGQPVPIHWVIETSETGDPETWAEALSGDITGPEAEESNPIAVGADPGLSPGKLYHYRLRATYAGQEAVTADETFTTLAVAKPTIENLAVGSVAAHTAHFSAQVNPNAPKEAGETDAAEQEAFLTHWHFECAPECPGLEGEVAADNSSHEVTAEATGLLPGQLYSVVLVAENAGGKETTAPVLFTTEAVQPQIDATFATEVSETEATLGAKVNPGGAATTFHFEYITLERFEADGNSFGAGTKKAPEPDEAVDSNYEDHTVESAITGLESNSAYRYRIVATNEKSSSGGTAGPTRGFHTTSPAQGFSGECPANEQLRRENNSTGLPDCRAYEQVSPVDKEGTDAVQVGAYTTQAAVNGEAIVYMSNGPFAGAQASLLPDAHFSTRTPGGWQTVDRTPPTPSVTPLIGGPGAILGYDFSEDLSQVVLKVPAQPLANLPVGNEGLFNLFLRKADGSYSLVNSAPPAEFPPPENPCHKFEGCFGAYDIAAFGGASSDFEHILFETNDSLVGTGAPGGFVTNLYESSGSQVHLVGVLPDGEVASTGSAPGAGISPYYSTIARVLASNVKHAISADGKRVLFSASSDEGEPNEAGQAGMTQLYDRIEGKETIEVSAPAPEATPANGAPQPAQFWNASEDGSLVFFTSAAELTTPSNTGAANNSPDLYRYDVDTETLTDLSVDTNPADAATGAGVLGVLGTSTDGSYAYFVATGELIPGVGVDGQPNLYVSHGGALEFITTLGAGDSADWTSNPASLRSYLTPDGKHLALMSAKGLPTANFPEGYDNTDQKSGEPDSEVYAYSAPSGAEAGELLCVSCNPSGARPTGPAFIGATLQELAGTPFHQPRVLSDSGNQLFFSSPDALAKGASGPFVKIYEYERAGAGSCAQQDGCLALISSALSNADDAFLDAGSDGKDVFFASLAPLSAGTEDGLYDVYDARVDGGFASTSEPSCEAEGCHGPASTRPPSSQAASNGFLGPEEGPKHPKCAKGQIKRHGHCVARKHHTKKHHRSHGRAADTNRRAGQ